MTPRHLALILAGLRCLQQVDDQCVGDLPGDLAEIINEHEGPDDASLSEEIDALCTELNLDNRYTVILSPPDHLGLQEDLFMRVNADDPVEAFTVACTQAAQQNDIDPDDGLLNFRIIALIEGWPRELSAYVI